MMTFCPRCKAPATKSKPTMDGYRQCNVCSAIYELTYVKKPITHTPLGEPVVVSPIANVVLREVSEDELMGCFKGG